MEASAQLAARWTRWVMEGPLGWLSTVLILAAPGWQVMAVAPTLDGQGDATRVPAHTSDLIELVSGVCQARTRLDVPKAFADRASAERPLLSAC